MMSAAVFRHRQRLYWICQLAGWSIASAAMFLFSLLGERPRAASGRYAIVFATGGVLAIAWTHAYRAFIRRRRWLALDLRRLLPRVLVASVLVGAAITASVTPVWPPVVHVDLTPLSAWAPAAVGTWSGSVLSWSLLYFGVHYFDRWQLAELDKLQLVIVAQDAQLHGLMAQLHPHFLFNCLNSVRALIVEDPAKAQSTVTALSSLIRHSLTAGKASTVPLADEIDMVKTYLGLEAVRFEERLATAIDIAGDAAALHVPTLLVQSLVENAVKYGIERSPDGGTIVVSAWREAGALRIRVTNPGRIAASADSTKIGLANARARLQLLYGAAATLALSEGDRTVTADVAIPIAETA
jgi:hypothetical protein